MKKTYVTSMPNHIGAFLKASKCFSKLGINITRVSYNKAVDSHTLFIDAEGTKEQLMNADSELEKIGYLQNNKEKSSIVLIEFCLIDVPGSVSGILELISEFNFNISYISSQENGTDYQLFKMGLYVDDMDRIAKFMTAAEKLCRVRVIDYNSSEKVYDNSIFYNAYVEGLSKTMGLSREVKKELVVYVNLAMQTLDETGRSPFTTFDYISRFCELMAQCRGENFDPRITHHRITENTEIILIEPPCGSNTTIIKSNGKYLFVDTGYACYKDEMTRIFNKLIPGFEKAEKTAFVTHADIDHCGLLFMFNRVFASPESAECLAREYNGEGGFREENPLHKSYINICKILTGYTPPEPEKVIMVGDKRPSTDTALTQTGFFDFEELHFEVYAGGGGHIPGETVLIDYEHHIAFTGDVYINLNGLTPAQKEYNRYAPILMTSVDTDRELCARTRQAILQRLGVGDWQIFGGHGFKKDYSINI